MLHCEWRGSCSRTPFLQRVPVYILGRKQCLTPSISQKKPPVQLMPNLRQPRVIPSRCYDAAALLRRNDAAGRMSDSFFATQFLRARGRSRRFVVSGGRNRGESVETSTPRPPPSPVLSPLEPRALVDVPWTCLGCRDVVRLSSSRERRAKDASKNVTGIRRRVASPKTWADA